ncbi:(2Fe-2S)-binding protein [Thalassobius sp. Cn5-15]|jgi:predicted molibdopterin-dependent oxidoreductase YjgC|uniref:(2Fe-2S)-binding protein n=1 Tax=Thalassobius sp. Cn5-15 TaxID=2917763 RepID=UPI001EF1C464|nr:(2Fe-2S)-binding protein [Thalassobius sp. Cn5-15]MCG7493176.1 (2Fe-2S)-binding protein [Thalassobius sp. Cn5-15]
MFDPLEPQGTNQVQFQFEDRQLSAPQGATVASALLGAGITAFRDTPVSGAARGPFCLMGACYDCLVSINGVTVQACMTPVQDGLQVKRVGSRQVDSEGAV